MGVFRKLTSMSTMGLVDFRSDKERIARSTRHSAHELRKQTRLMQSAAADGRVGNRGVDASVASATAKVRAQSIELNRQAMLAGREVSARARREVLADDVRHGTHNSYPTPAVSPPADGAPVAPSRGEQPAVGQPQLVDQLIRLAELRAQGAITDDEFAVVKARLVGG
jgi:Short C-terminal domain